MIGVEISACLILQKASWHWDMFGQKLSERFGDLGEVLDEAAVKPHVTKETPQPFDWSRRGKSLYDLNLILIDLDAPSRNNMTQYHPFLHHEMTFFPIQHKIDFLTSMEYLGQNFQMQVKGTSINGEIIHEYLHDILNKIKKYGNHGPLESSRGIT